MDAIQTTVAISVHSRALVAAAGAVLLLAAVRPAEASRPPEGELRRFADAMNRGDPRAAVALFAPTGLYRGVLVCDPDPCVGQAAIGEALAWESADRTRHRPLPDGRGELRSDSLAALAERVVYRATVESGPEGIVALRLEPDADDPQTAQVLGDVAHVRSLMDDWAASGEDGPLTLPLPGW